MNKFTVIAKKATFWQVVEGKQKRISKARFEEILTQKIVKTEKRETETVYYVEEREEIVLQFFTINQNGNFILCSGFKKSGAILTTENRKGFETIPNDVARSMLNKSVCVLNAPDSALNKRHKQHIRNFLKRNQNEQKSSGGCA